MDLKIHHIGYAVPDVAKAEYEFGVLGWKTCSGVTDDTVRQVRIVFMERDGHRIELVAPLSASSPINKILSRGSGTPYHICYEVPSLEAAEAELKKARFIPFKKAAEASAIGGRRVEFMYAKQVGVIELVESEK